MTYSIFQESLFEGSTSSQGVPLVNPSAKQENDKVQTMNGISFPSFYEWWQKQDHVGLSLRMFTDSLISSLDKYSRRITHHWKVKVTPFKRYVFQLQPSTPRTDATDFGSLLPTPTTQEVEHPEAALTPSGRRLAENGNSHSLNLADTLLLTPTASENVQDIDKFKARMEKYPNGTTMPNLATQISALLKTPTTFDATVASPKANPVSGDSGSLAQEMMCGYRDNGTNPGSTLRLEPAFVEWMMGYPINYTSLEAETTE